MSMHETIKFGRDFTTSLRKRGAGAALRAAHAFDPDLYQVTLRFIGKGLDKRTSLAVLAHLRMVDPEAVETGFVDADDDNDDPRYVALWALAAHLDRF